VLREETVSDLKGAGVSDEQLASVKDAVNRRGVVHERFNLAHRLVAILAGI